MNSAWILVGLMASSFEGKVSWTDTPVSIDGKADDAIWQKQTTTGWKAAWDKDCLYLFFPNREVPQKRLFFANDKTSVSFEVSPEGALLWAPMGQKKIPSQGRTKIQDNALEMAIPWVEFSALGARPDPDSQWLAGVGTFPPQILKFSIAGRSSELVGLPTWSGSPDPGLPFKTKQLFSQAKLPFPVCIAPIPQSSAYFVSTQPGPYAQTTVLRFSADRPEQSEKVLELDGVIYDIVFHPEFAKNRYVFVGANGKFGTNQPHKTRVIRYEVSAKEPFQILGNTAQTIIDWESNGHNGGAICFGTDGMMYVTSGDGTSDSDLNLAGQDTTKRLAKVLRIDVDHPNPGRAYSIPKDNPWVANKDFVPEAWAMGLRNPWRIACDPATGNIWVGNNGQDLWETVYLVRKGDNYGWSVLEGTHDFYPDRKAGPKPFAKPAAEHHHREARSLTGGVVYHGKKFPQLKGHYLYGDYSTGKIWSLAPPSPDATLPLSPSEIADTPHQITGFAIDHDGEVLILDHLTGIHTLEPNPLAGKKGNFPTLLSQSGFFSSLKEYKLRPGILPYEVNSPLWSDGAFKVRHFFIPDRMDKDGNRFPQAATHSGSGPWNFPDGTVIIKSFALELKPGDEASRKWIETRFLVKEENEWTGYSYSWNDEQTEATLVGTDGANRDFVLSGGPGKQTWRYPSRAECMVCHSRAAGFVLGLCDLQLNKEVNHQGKRVNQITLLESLGKVNENWGSLLTDRLKDRAKAASLKPSELDAWIAANTPPGGFPNQTLILESPPEKLAKLPNPLDPKTGSLEERVRSYLHVNCAVCHVEAGGGNSKIRLDWAAKPKEMNLIDVPPSHHSFGLPQARLVAPGFPERSVLLHRLGMNDQGKMPPVGRSVVDREALKLVTDWIRGMPAQSESRADSTRR